LTEDGEVRGVKLTTGLTCEARAVVLACGTFLNGMVHIGPFSQPAGRAWEFPANYLSKSLAELGFSLLRFNTGTTPRIDSRTVDFSHLIPQPGSSTPLAFSFWNIPRPFSQRPSYLTHTNERTHQIVRDNLQFSPSRRGDMSK